MLTVGMLRNSLTTDGQLGSMWRYVEPLEKYWD